MIAPQPPGLGDARPAAVLQSIMQRRRARPRPGERCDMCGETIPEPHSHVVNLDQRNLMCTCRACYLLFTNEGAAGGRYRAVPDRYLADANFRLGDEDWNSLQIPVDVAFFFRNSVLDQLAAFYPSPAGATESELSLETWDRLAAANPLLAELEPDVEAILVRRDRRGFECYLVPIDVCYELVGLVRSTWKGFDGGREVWADIDSFFADVRTRAERKS